MITPKMGIKLFIQLCKAKTSSSHEIIIFYLLRFHLKILLAFFDNFFLQDGILIHKPVVRGSGHSFVGKIQKTLEGFLDENEEGNE